MGTSRAQPREACKAAQCLEYRSLLCKLQCGSAYEVARIVDFLTLSILKFVASLDTTAHYYCTVLCHPARSVSAMVPTYTIPRLLRAWAPQPYAALLVAALLALSASPGHAQVETYSL